MAGRGFASNPDREPTRKGNKKSFRVVEFDPAAQPELPTVQVEQDGELVEFTWPAQTQTWWKMWREHPLSKEFSDSDWSFLLDTALIHARFWLGGLSQAAELRLRVAKFGATLEDRSRLQVQFAAAAEAGEKLTPPDVESSGGSSRYGHLRIAD